MLIKSQAHLLKLQFKQSSQVIPSEVSSLPQTIFAGEVHFSRIPFEYWEHRILMIKSLGLNAISVYIMWNYHEKERGVFDYSTGNKNLTKFLELAKKHDMYVLIRPGPYVCGEWDFGGMPARLLGINDLVIRSNNQPFLREVKLYFQSLAPILSPFLSSNGGPIVLLQIQNEYGFYGSDKSYIQALRSIWSQLAIKVEEYYVDVAKNLYKCHWPGANIGINDGTNQTQYDYARVLQRRGKIFGGQIYPGWLTHWGQKTWGDKTIEKIKKEYQFLLKHGHSFAMYMSHGGSNFGKTAGANFGAYSSDKKAPKVYQPHITSYDYNSPINEQGSPNQKFFILKQMIEKYAKWDIPNIPSPIQMIQIKQFTPQLSFKLFDNVKVPDLKDLTVAPYFQSDSLKMYHQGMVLYETLLQKKTYYMTLEIHDYALIYLDGKFLKVLDRSIETTHKFPIKCESQSCVLRILIQAMGHINYAHEMQTDRKGLISIKDDVKTQFNWNIYKFPLDSQPSLNNDDNKNSYDSPIIYKSEIQLQQVGDVYFNLTKWTKGYLWVNGINLGRYWSEKGPQYKVFCPGVWLRKGVNEVLLLDLLQTQPNSITGDKQLKE